MRLTFHDSQIAIVDEVLAPDVFGLLWGHLQSLRYESVHDDHVHGVWRLLDGNPLKGPLVALLEDEPSREEAEALTKKGRLLFPTGTVIDNVLQAVAAAPPEARGLVGDKGKDWFALSARPWIYPAGTRLSWHDDESVYCGAFVYYAHPSWNALWGGELLVAHEAVRARAQGRPNSTFSQDEGLHLENQLENDQLMQEGHGRFVAAKPNRMVFLAAGVSHMIAQVHAAAGDHPRVTVSGFFLRKPRTGTETLDRLFGPQSRG